jgi:hypothetical protein
MKALRQCLISLLSMAALAAGVVHAAPRTDYTDQWWVPSESGWGAAILQQADTLFVNLMVYGPDSKPTWYTAAAWYDGNSATGHQVFVGDLYATNGSYYGAPWNPAALGERKVGTLSFDAAGADRATLAYVVDGSPVVKDVVRQSWSFEDLSGTYDAIWQNSCGGNNWHSGPLDGFSSTVIQHGADNRVTMTITYPFYWSDDETVLRGRYTQSGHLGRIVGDMIVPASGAVVIFEIAKTGTGFTARFSDPGDACPLPGRVVAVRSAR